MQANFPKTIQMCTKYLYILTHFLEKEEKYDKFPTNSGKVDKVLETFLQVVEQEENV